MQFLGWSKAMLRGLDIDSLKNIPDDIALIETTTKIPPNLQPQKCIVITESSLEPEKVIEVISSTGSRHVVQKTHGDFLEEIKTSVEIIKDPAGFLDDPFKLLNINGKKLEIAFNKSNEKEKVRNLISDYINSISSLRVFSDSILTIADEFFMNAIYDAPVDEKRQHKFAKVSRDTEVALNDGQVAKFSLICGEKKFAITCQDPFGSINGNDFLKHLQHCYAGPQLAVRTGVGGAGIGTRMIFDSSEALYVVSKKDLATVFCSILHPGLKASHAEIAAKNLHLAME